MKKSSQLIKDLHKNELITNVDAMHVAQVLNIEPVTVTQTEGETNNVSQSGEHMNIETVANENEVSKVIFKALTEKQRAVRTTSLTNLYRSIHQANPSVAEKDFLAVFKHLEQARAGKLIFGRKNNHNRFEWNYNLKDVANMGIGKGGAPKPAPKSKRMKRMKPAQINTTPLVANSSTNLGPRFQFDIQLSPSVSAADIQALVELVQSLQNK